MAPHVAMCSPMLRQIFRLSSYISPKQYAAFSSRLLFSTATTSPPNEQEAESKEEKPAVDPSLLACQEENRKLLEQIKTVDVSLHTYELKLIIAVLATVTAV
ncbi:hypothetical protein V5799_007651 [Amblyomma americanum]|uniref:Uncharacterized protein n=1 Tax=Amblyomma americanum TaxID=6943 RepID=A0AAQ4FGS8_AMBAM